MTELTVSARECDELLRRWRAECGDADSFVCYMLVSANNTHRKTYIGYTRNPFHRLRQHNGEITGGARYTTRFGPWRVRAVVAGFTDKSRALSYEWHWKKRASGIPARLRRAVDLCGPVRARLKGKFFGDALFILDVVGAV
jgi:predicted GIY-YIG superfamily endonuclease